MNEITKRLKEASLSILPIVCAVLLVILVVPGMTLEVSGNRFGPIVTSLILSSVPLILGTALFSIGAEKSVAKIGEIVGQNLTKRKSLFLLLFIAFLLGVLATIAEPDLTVLASRISPDGPDWILILIASLGVGLFLVVALVRVIYHKPLKYWLTIGYLLAFSLGLFADPSFFSIIFDSGGVTTRVITVPFILALGMSVSRVLGGENAEDESFGYSGLCSLGTVLSAMVFSIILKKTGGLLQIQDVLVEKFDPNQITSLTDSMMIPLFSYGEMGKLYLSNMLHSVKDVFIALLPIALFFVVFNFFVKIKGKALGSIIVGFVYTFFGMILFFTGAESGFIPMATMLGKWFSQSSADIFPLFLVVIALFGLISMMAEPSVKILAGNVEEVSQGVISKKVIILVLGISTAISLIINALRIQYHFDYLYVIVPLFLFALLLSFIAPSIYVGIAIDSAGVATGTMASCFFLPMFIGFVASKNSASLSFGQVLMQDGFGVVGIMSVMPIITMEMMGILAEMKLKLNYQKALAQVLESDDCQVIHLPEWEG